MWIVCGYYTGDVYKVYAQKLIESLRALDISYDIIEIPQQGDWYKNTQYKPTFLKMMLKKHPETNLIYVDTDAIFCRHPDYFDKLDKELEVNIAVHLLNHSKRRRKNHPAEMLSGTIYLKNTEKTRQIVDEWIVICEKGGTLWDQRALAEVLRNHRYHLLPEEYTTIFDYMSDVKDPVIKHFQASREERRKMEAKANTPLRQRSASNSTPRRVVQNGRVLIKRMNPR